MSRSTLKKWHKSRLGSCVSDFFCTEITLNIPSQNQKQTTDSENIVK